MHLLKSGKPRLQLYLKHRPIPPLEQAYLVTELYFVPRTQGGVFGDSAMPSESNLA